MLYPFSITLDLHIQAESYDDAKKIAEAFAQDALLDASEYPEINQDEVDVSNYIVLPAY